MWKIYILPSFDYNDFLGKIKKIHVIPMPILLGNLDSILPKLVSSLKPSLYCTMALVRVRGQGHYSLV